MYELVEIPIVDTARLCGVLLRESTANHMEVEATCPFCGDHGAGKYHLSLNTVKNQYRCNLCGASGNSITHYARLRQIDNKQAYWELTHDGTMPRIFTYPQQNRVVVDTEAAPLSRRHDAYYDLLEFLTLFPKHRENLLRRGFDEGRIQDNCYRSMPIGKKLRRDIAGELAKRHDLAGIPGFYLDDNGFWSIAGRNGILIPYCTAEGYIQGFQIRLNDDEIKDGKDRKYRSFSSYGFEGGSRGHAWVHITGDVTSRRAFLTEGALKGDAASFLSGDSLFVCMAGVNASSRLEDSLMELGIEEAAEAIDMDKRENWRVRGGLARIRLVLSRFHVRRSVCDWDPQFNGVDDYLLHEAQNQRPMAA